MPDRYDRAVCATELLLRGDILKANNVRRAETAESVLRPKPGGGQYRRYAPFPGTNPL